VREGLDVSPFMQGGGQEMRRRAGTENVAAIAGFAEAVKQCVEDLANSPLWLEWRMAFETRVTQEAPEAVVMGQDAMRVSSIIALAMPGASQETQLMNFDLAGFAVSAGSACSSGKVQPSHVLQAMGAGSLAAQAIRISFGWATRREELEAFASCWIDVYRRSQKTKVAA
jgi:cysteine desulfurase